MHELAARGIGTTSPDGVKLAVSGEINANRPYAGARHVWSRRPTARSRCRRRCRASITANELDFAEGQLRCDRAEQHRCDARQAKDSSSRNTEIKEGGF